MLAFFRALTRTQEHSLKTKIFGSILVAVLVVSGIIALLARWILVSSLTEELQHRGKAIAQSVADRASGFILDQDYPQLVALVFDSAQLGERKDLISFVYVKDQGGTVLAHTFTRPFPPSLADFNPLAPDKDSSVRLVTDIGPPAYDIAVPVKEGIYRIGTVHVGLSQSHIDNLVSKLRITFLGFISLVIVIIFAISLRLASTITRPIHSLIAVADELSRGNFDIRMDTLVPGLRELDCPAYRNTDLPCWHFDQEGGAGPTAVACDRCCFYAQYESDRHGNEVVQLAESFRTMVWSIKLYRRRLRESEEKYRSLFDSGPDPVFVVDVTDSTILDANPRAEEMYGFGRRELHGMSFTTLDPEFPHANILELGELAEPSTSGIPEEVDCAYCTKVIHYTKDTTPFFVNMHACPISYLGQQAFIIAVTDITDMIEKDAQLIQASKMKTLGEMSAGVAHELNQPLNAIKMGSDYLTMVEGTGGDPEARAAVVKQISAQVDRASEIINTLRAFGRKAEMRKDTLNVNQSIRGVLNLMTQQLALSDISVELDLAEGLPPILAHDNRLQQVLFNLFSNARDAILQTGGPPLGQGTITITTGQKDGRVLISVRDTGVGIAAEDQEKVFEPFYTTKETGQGMGLGLSISYGIVRDYGGDIAIDSTPGHGTTFTLSFPAHSRAANIKEATP